MGRRHGQGVERRERRPSAGVLGDDDRIRLGLERAEERLDLRAIGVDRLLDALDLPVDPGPMLGEALLEVLLERRRATGLLLLDPLALRVRPRVDRLAI